jgi:hypothetical protein
MPDPVLSFGEFPYEVLSKREYDKKLTEFIRNLSPEGKEKFREQLKELGVNIDT